MTLSEKEIKLLKEAWQALDYSMIEEDEDIKAEMIKKAMDNIRSLFQSNFKRLSPKQGLFLFIFLK